MRLWFILLAALFLAGCSSHRAPPPNPRLADSITVIANLNEQLRNWRGAPYRYGGMSPRGVDCSGFVLMTFRDKFALQLPRETRDQAEIGTKIDKSELLPGIWSFSKPGRRQRSACGHLRYRQSVYPRLDQPGRDALLPG